MKIQLYTCKSGLNLCKLGESFGAWDSDSPSYKSEPNNIVIFVDKEDIEASGDGYRVVNVKSVEIIG